MLRRINQAEFETLTDGCTTLSADAHGAKVLRLPDGRIVKLFRLKHRWSSARIRPYAQRFAVNARQLADLGIPTVDVLDCFRIQGLARDAVLYRELPGETLRHHLHTHGDSTALWTRVARFLATLHAHGILFRSIHFGNILIRTDGCLGLIDVADLRIRRRPLTQRERLRNIHHFLRRQEDRALFATANLDDFLDAYQTETPLSPQILDALGRTLRLASRN